jgi:hypothetical protein
LTSGMSSRGGTTRRAVVAALVTVVFASGCAPQPVQAPSAPVRNPQTFEPPPAVSQRPDLPEQPSARSEISQTFPEQVYQHAAAQGEPIFRVDPAKSTAVIEVRRAGSLARLGHDHVVASHDLRGYVDPAAGRADLYVRLDQLVVDEPALREEAGFDTDPSPDAIAGTRRNMLEHTLEADRYPFAMISVRKVDAAAYAKQGERSGGDRVPDDIDVTITLHGTTKTFRVPMRITGDSEVIDVAGQIAFKQSDFGIVPLSILGGAIAVQDDVRLRFRIQSHRFRPDRDPPLQP